MEKLSSGVLRVLTPLGPRYTKPSALQRLYLLWIFRHFPTLPQQVLSPRQQRLVDSLCSEDRFVLLMNGNGVEGNPIIGTVERQVPVRMGDPSPPVPSRASEMESSGRFATG